MTPTILLSLYAALIVVASLVGGLLPGMLRLGHRSLQIVLSFVAGVMLGVGFFHMLPHAVMLRLESSGTEGHDLLDPVMLWAVLGFLALFLLERFSHFHQHEPLEEEAGHEGCGHDHGKGHDHGRPHDHGPATLGWFGALIGLGVHSLLEGVALAASVAVGAAHGGGKAMALAGFATFLVILLHKPFDSMTLATLMRHGGASRPALVGANILLALLVPAGVLLFALGASGEHMATVAVPALAFSAGMFLCIASSDLLPELQFHRHDRVLLSTALFVGLGFAFVLGRFEAATHPPHDHAAHAHDGNGPAAAHPEHDPNHGSDPDHDHQ